MATPKFEYPTATAPTNTLTFTEGGRLVKDSPEGKNDNLVTERAPDGSLLSWNFGGDGQRVFPFSARVKIAHATEADMADVVNWIENICEWSKNTFVWTDESGVARTVTLTNTSYRFDRFGLDTYEVLLTLEEVPA